MKKCDSIIMTESKENHRFILCCTGHISERTFQPASVSSLQQSKERCSGSPPAWPQDLLNIHHQPSASTFKPFESRCVSKYELTDDVCVDLHLSVLLRQLESLIVTVRQNQEVNG